MLAANSDDSVEASASSRALALLARSPAPSEPGSPARRPAVVPRLSLPVTAASTPGTASRRSIANTEQRGRWGLLFAGGGFWLVGCFEGVEGLEVGCTRGCCRQQVRLKGEGGAWF